MYIFRNRKTIETVTLNSAALQSIATASARCPFSAFPLKKRASCCAKHTITASAFRHRARIPDSEYKIGQALADGARYDIIIATKTASTTR